MKILSPKQESSSHDPRSNQMPPSRTPTVAVIVTCYNLGRFLEEAVESVLCQTYQDFEVVIVDDGSTDPETCRLLAGYERPRTRVLRSNNRGLSAARNLGIRATQSPYITTLDADDRFAPTLLEKSVRMLEADRTIGFVSHWLRTFGDETWEWTPERCDLAALVDANAVNGAALMRRETFQAVGGFDEEMREGCEDWDFWISVVEAGIVGAIIPEVLYEYRRRPDSMSRLMMAGDRHAKLYAYLARKHRASFSRHLPDVLASREREMSGLRRHVEALEREHTAWLQPEVSRHRDDLASLARKLERYSAGDDRVAGLQEALAKAHRERIAAEERFREAARAAELRGAELAALKASGSWRVTEPLRTVYGWLRRSRGAQP